MNHEVIPRLQEIGSGLLARVNRVIDETNSTELVSLSGHPTWAFLNWTGSDAYSLDFLKTYFMQEMFQNGILMLGTHNVNLANTTRDLDKVEASYISVFNSISDGIKKDNLKSKIRVTPLSPLFKVR
jgi:glutamate-1-semialdehyde 2,1-aminomutase